MSIRLPPGEMIRGGTSLAGEDELGDMGSAFTAGTPEETLLFNGGTLLKLKDRCEFVVAACCSKLLLLLFSPVAAAA